MTLITCSFPSRRISTSTMSPGMYSPMSEEMEPDLPMRTPPMARMISLSLRPALAAGPLLVMAEY